MQHQIKNTSKKPESYLEDTPDLLRFLGNIGPLPDRGRHPRFLATIDLSALYSKIQWEDGIEAVRKALENVPADFILELLDLDLVKYCTAYLSYLSPISVTCCQVTGKNIFCRHPLALSDHGTNSQPELETGDMRLAELKKMFRDISKLNTIND